VSELGDALTGLLRGGQAPRDINQLAELFGESPRQQNPAIVRALMDLGPEERRPPKRTEEGRRYDALYRSLLRYRRGERDPSRSETGRGFIERLRRLARGRLTAANVRRARKEGLKLRLRARYSFYPGRKYQTSTMPADSRGQELWLHIDPGDEAEEILDLWESGDHDGAGDLLEEAFFSEYEMPEPEDIDYEWVEVRFGGEAGARWFK
jgi:hypothetical protein